jgi:hypothetical protein
MKNQENNIETITIEQKMSVEELEKATKRLVEIVHELRDLEEEQKDINKGFNDRKKSLKEIMNIKGEEALTAIRKVQVNVTRRVNSTTNEYEFVDVETQEIVKTEPFLLPPAPLFDSVDADELPPAPTDYEEFEEVEDEA